MVMTGNGSLFSLTKTPDHFPQVGLRIFWFNKFSVNQLNCFRTVLQIGFESIADVLRFLVTIQKNINTIWFSKVK